MNKFKLAFTGALGILVLNSVAQNRTIAFEHGTFAEIKAKALKENKLIFVDAYTTWCGPCKWMASNVFTNDTVADYFNKNLVSAKIDMEKGEGIELAKLYEVQCYPNLLFIDGNGNLVHRAAGSMSSQSFVALAETATKPEQRFSYYKENYEAKKTNSEFLVNYITAYSNTCLKPKEAVKTYFSLQKDADLTSKTNWTMIQENINDLESREFKYLIANKAAFDKLYTEKEVNDKIDAVCKATLYEAMKGKPMDEAKYTAAKTKVSALNQPNTKMVLFDADMRLAQKKNDWVAYAKLAVDNVDTYYSKESNTLNGIAWNFYEHVTDAASMLKAEEWAKKSTELNMGYANLDTYAYVLYKNGKKDLALETANKAIRYAKSDKYTPEDYKSTTELMEKIKGLK